MSNEKTKKERNNHVVLSNIVEITCRVVNNLNPTAVGEKLNNETLTNKTTKHIVVNKLRLQLADKLAKSQGVK